MPWLAVAGLGTFHLRFVDQHREGRLGFTPRFP